MPFSLFSTAHLWSYRRSVFLCFLIEIRETLSFSKPDPIYSWIFLSQLHFSTRHPPLMITHEFYSGEFFSLMNPLMIFTRATHDYSKIPVQCFWGTTIFFSFFSCFSRLFPVFLNREIDFSIKKSIMRSKKHFVKIHKILSFRYRKIDFGCLKWSRMIPGTK